MSFPRTLILCLTVRISEQVQHAGSELGFVDFSGYVRSLLRKPHAEGHHRKFHQGVFIRHHGHAGHRSAESGHKQSHGHKHSHSQGQDDFVQAAKATCQNNEAIAAIALDPYWEAYQLTDALKNHGGGPWTWFCGGMDSKHTKAFSQIP
jgi:hypothetical protein